MTHAELGQAIIINNLRSQAPDTVSDVHALRAALETVGFNVKCYDDCNVQVSALYYDFTLLYQSPKFKNFMSMGMTYLLPTGTADFLSGG